MAHKERQYECVIYGASGYTGEYCATHIAASLPTDFSFAIAGRSETKLRKLAEQLKRQFPDRTQPGIEVAQLQKDDLERLCRKGVVLINAVGPYYKYSTPVVEAAAKTGTHYLDVTGESPWTYAMLQSYETLAKRNKAIIINQIGVESAPADLLAWRLVTFIREELNVGTAEVVQSTHILDSAPSGGTLATVLGIFEAFSLSHFAKATNRWSMSAVPPPTQHYKKGLWELLTGMRTVKGLPGPLTDSIQATSDLPIVHRSWSLYDAGRYYGDQFYVSTYMRCRSVLAAIAIHYALNVGVLWLLFPPVRWILKRLVYQPGEGPDRETSKKDRVEWRAIATADTPDQQRAYMSFRFDGSMYHLTRVFLAEAALILTRSQTFAHEIGGGFLTPATLGMPYFERLQAAGIKTEIKML